MFFRNVGKYEPHIKTLMYRALKLEPAEAFETLRFRDVIPEDGKSRFASRMSCAQTSGQGPGTPEFIWSLLNPHNVKDTS
jgi:hypothetical protein